MDKVLIGIGSCLIVGILWMVFGLIIAWGIEWTWNQCVPLLFHGPTMNYGEACALYALLSLITGIFRAPFLGKSNG